MTRDTQPMAAPGSPAPTEFESDAKRVIREREATTRIAATNVTDPGSPPVAVLDATLEGFAERRPLTAYETTTPLAAPISESTDPGSPATPVLDAALAGFRRPPRQEVEEAALESQGVDAARGHLCAHTPPRPYSPRPGAQAPDAVILEESVTTRDRTTPPRDARATQDTSLDAPCVSLPRERDGDPQTIPGLGNRRARRRSATVFASAGGVATVLAVGLLYALVFTSTPKPSADLGGVSSVTRPATVGTDAPPLAAERASATTAARQAPPAPPIPLASPSSSSSSTGPAPAARASEGGAASPRHDRPKAIPPASPTPPPLPTEPKREPMKDDGARSLQ
jgi:hypothetical protein